MELNINNKTYEFRFGMGFLREINGRVKRSAPNAPDIKEDIGLQMAIAGLIDGDPVALVDILEVANKGQNPRVKRSELDEYIDDIDTDIDALFDEVLSELKKQNATKKKTLVILTEVERLTAETNQD